MATYIRQISHIARHRATLGSIDSATLADIEHLLTTITPLLYAI